MKRFIRNISILMFLFVLTPSAGTAQTEKQVSDVMDVLKPNVEKTLSVLQNPELSRSEKKVKIEKIVNRLFQYRLMSKLVLGKKHWPGLNEKQKKRYVRLFTEILKSSYFQKMEEVSDVNVTYQEPVRKGKRKVHVPSVVQFQDNNVNVEYRMFWSDQEGSWNVYDVVIKGVSIVKSYHSQYSDYLEDHTIGELLERMSQKVEELKMDRQEE